MINFLTRIQLKNTLVLYKENLEMKVMNVLVVVDMQNDFIDGALGTDEAVKILPGVIEKVKNFNGKIYFTMDTHPENYMDTQEGKNLPVPHCIKDTFGWEIRKELRELAREKSAIVFEKATFGCTDLSKELVKVDSAEKIESIELIGLCTDICVVSNALLIKAALPETKIKVDSNCCAGVTPEKHKAALTTMSSCQIEIL